MTGAAGKKLIAGATVAALLLAGLAWWQFGTGNADDDADTLYGNVDIREVQLGFRVGGRLQSLEAEEGDRVSPGDLLASLDPKLYADALAVADARVSEARANLSRVKSGARPQEIEQARLHINEANAAFVMARQNFQRQSDLMSSQSTTQTQLDSARAQYEQAEAVLESARSALELLQAGARREDIVAAEAAVASSQAQREQALTQLNDAQLAAPAAGVITTRAREIGAMLAAGQSVYTLALTGDVYVRAYVAEPLLGRVAPGNKVTITTDSSDKTYTGQIGFVSPQAEFTPKSVETPELRTDLVYRLRIVVLDADDGLRQGMPVTITLPSSDAHSAQRSRPEHPGQGLAWFDGNRFTGNAGWRGEHGVDG